MSILTMNKAKEIDRYLFYRKLDKIILFTIGLAVLIGIFYWQWNLDERLEIDYKTGTMIGFDKGFNITADGYFEGEPVFLVRMDDGRKVKVRIPPGALMLKDKKVEIMETKNIHDGHSTFELIQYLHEDN